MKNLFTPVVLALAILLCALAISLGILTSRQGIAQGGVSVPYMRILPLQRDLWSFSADGSNTWDPGSGGHVLTVLADVSGRLPVLTTIHARGYVRMGNYYNSIIARKINGIWQSWEIGDIQRPPGQEISRFHNSAVGVVLSPGEYLISGAMDESSHALLLSGYWAPR